MQTYVGQIRTPADATILFEACRQGVLPKIQRRLSDRERAGIKHGSVFVWDEREAGMRRWTDGKAWSASRVAGPFLMYREMDGRKGGPASKRIATGKSPPREESDDSGDGVDGYAYKPDGLVKQSFSITTTEGQRLHLVSYTLRSTNASQDLPIPSKDHSLAHVQIPKGLYPETAAYEEAPRSVLRLLQPQTSGPSQTISPQPVQHVHPSNYHYGHSSGTVSPSIDSHYRQIAEPHPPHAQHAIPNARLAHVSPPMRHTARPYDRMQGPPHSAGARLSPVMTSSGPSGPPGYQQGSGHAISSLHTSPVMVFANTEAERGRQLVGDHAGRSYPMHAPYPAGQVGPYDAGYGSRGLPMQSAHGSLFPSTESSRSSSAHRRTGSNSSFVDLPSFPDEATLETSRPAPGRWSEERRALDALKTTLRL